jgi:trimeric autotransporter adhesin
LYGSEGNDVYLFGKGDGKNEIFGRQTSASELDILRFKLGVLPSDVQVNRTINPSLPGDGDWLDFVIASTGDRVRVSNYFYTLGGGPSRALQQVEFADGTVWNASRFVAMATLVGTIGTVGNDTLVGGSGADLLTGLGGADSLVGAEGDDWLDGGVGADAMFGGRGNDTYVVDALLDSVVEFVGEGTDTVESNISWSLGANLENLRLSGVGAIDATGNELGNVLMGNNANNTLDGGTGADTMQGGLGDDVYVVDQAGDVVAEAAGGGVDTVKSTISFTLENELENLTLVGSNAIDGTGNALGNVIRGNTANNILTGMAGADTLLGGAGNDTYRVDAADDVIVEAAGEGVDVIESSVSLALPANIENLTLTGIAAIDATGNALNNALLGNSANNRLDGGAGVDTMAGAGGNDVYVVDDIADVVIEATGGGVDSVESTATYVLPAEVEKLTLMGTASIGATGNAAANTLIGNVGANRLDGGAGADTMVGGVGDDTYVVDSGADVITEAASAGIDTVESSLTFTLGNNLENLTLTGGAAINGTGNTANNAVVGNSAANRLDGAGGADTMSGGAGDDTYVVDNAGDIVIESTGGGIDSVESSVSYSLTSEVEKLMLTGIAAINGTGNSLANVLTGNAGANRLDGGAGADSMTGGANNDTYVVDNFGDTTIEFAGGGTDTVESSITWALASEVENLTLTGATAINGTGNSLANTLRGNAGDNLLDGGLGNDTMLGGAGNDIYVVDVATDVITENANEGTDTVQAGLTWTLGANLENLVLTGTSAINGTGNTLANTLTGNSGANRLDGGGGADTLIGGAGNDTYVVENAGDVITELAAQGTDTVETSISWTLAAEVENLTLTGTGGINATGNALANTLLGNSGANRLDGGAGVDSMTGGAGNDTYVVDNIGDTAIEVAAGGTDTIESSLNWTLGAELENLTLTGTSAINATGNALGNTLRGNAGNNTLDGGAGNDTMIGGAGDDVYKVDAATDVVTELLNEGRDRVETTVTLTLSANVEDLTLLGTTAINGTGNSLDNILLGNSAANTLTGGAGNDALNGNAGADTMIGNAGNDTYFVDNTADVTTEALNEGIDTVNSTVTWTLGSNLENLTLLGATAINGIGNTLDNMLAGNSAANTLTGNAGSDTLDGGAGADTLIGGTGNDKYVVGRGYGAELVQENDATAGNTDVMQFLSGVAKDQIWFRKVGNDLEVSIIGTADKAMVQNWYLGSQYHVEQFKTSDGKTLLDSKVQDLVSAMAAFTPPAIGQTTLPSNYQTTLLPVIAADWGP